MTDIYEKRTAKILLNTTLDYNACLRHYRTGLQSFRYYLPVQSLECRIDFTKYFIKLLQYFVFSTENVLTVTEHFQGGHEVAVTHNGQRQEHVDHSDHVQQDGALFPLLLGENVSRKLLHSSGRAVRHVEKVPRHACRRYNFYSYREYKAMINRIIQY